MRPAPSPAERSEFVDQACRRACRAAIRIEAGIEFGDVGEQQLAGGAPMSAVSELTVATVGSDMRPSTRVVLIKGFDERGIVWFTNYDSRKGRQILRGQTV